jgi:hypothetical protein
MNIDRIFQSALLAHQLSSTYAEVSVDYDGRRVKLYMTPFNYIDALALYVELLTETSTPREAEVDEQAKPKLERAIIDLINKGTTFYTHFRANWNLPGYLWRIKI